MTDKPKFYELRPETPNPDGKPASRNLFIQYNPEHGIHDLEHWHNVFVEMCDPTEYGPAIELAGSWKEWNRIKRDWPTFRKTILPDWLEEVEVKIRSDAVRSLVKQAKSDKGTPAARFLAEGKYSPKTKGRPKKEDVQREARIQAGVDKEVEEDLERVSQFLN